MKVIRRSKKTYNYEKNINIEQSQKYKYLEIIINKAGNIEDIAKQHIGKYCNSRPGTKQGILKRQ